MKRKKVLMFLGVFVLLINCFANNKSMAEEEMSKKNNNKVIYLTFDDGPSINNTKKVIDILKKEEVPATFFLIGENTEHYPQLVRELQKNNMAIGAHSYTHKLNQIYKSSESYIKDLEKCLETLEKILGEKTIDITRMPCGSTSNTCSKWVKNGIKKSIRDKGISYIDWNVSGEDALARNIPSYKIKNNVLRSSKDKDTIVLLLHDGYYNSTTAQVLPEIIKYYKENGYTFKSLKNLCDKDKKELERTKVLNR